MPDSFAIFDVVRGYGSEPPLRLVCGEVVKETRTLWLLAQCYRDGAFGYRRRVPRDSYARTPTEAWRKYAEAKRAEAERLRADAGRLECYAAFAENQCCDEATDPDCAGN